MVPPPALCENKGQARVWVATHSLWASRRALADAISLCNKRTSREFQAAPGIQLACVYK